MSKEEKQDAKQDLDGLHSAVDELKWRQNEVIQFVSQMDPAGAPAIITAYENNSKDCALTLDEIRRTLSSIRIEPNETAPIPVAHCMASTVSNYAYAKEQLPSFNGEIWWYPAWKREWKECILPNREEGYRLDVRKQWVVAMARA